MFKRNDNDADLLKTEGKVWTTYLAFISSVYPSCQAEQ